MKPVFINNQKDFLRIKRTYRPIIVDELDEQIKELELVRDPKLLFQRQSSSLEHKKSSCWIYYPWRNTMTHCLEDKDFNELRLSRNKELIINKEQKKIDGALVAFAGLNVGNPGAICIALESLAKMKLADNDSLSVSNLNRFRAGVCDLGINKAVLTARQIYEINPFAKLEVFEKGIDDKNIDEFLLKPKVDVLVEETDNLALKIKIRELARQSGIPVVMVTGNAENVIIDVERFDLDRKLPLLNGYLKKEIIEKIKNGSNSFSEKIKLAQDFMGVKYLHPRLIESFKQVGTKLAGIPQLAESSFLRGAAISFFVRQIIQGKNVKSGRYYLELDSLI